MRESCVRPLCRPQRRRAPMLESPRGLRHRGGLSEPDLTHWLAATGANTDHGRLEGLRHSFYSVLFAAAESAARLFALASLAAARLPPGARWTPAAQSPPPRPRPRPRPRPWPRPRPRPRRARRKPSSDDDEDDDDDGDDDDDDVLLRLSPSPSPASSGRGSSPAPAPASSTPSPPSPCAPSPPCASARASPPLL